MLLPFPLRSHRAMAHGALPPTELVLFWDSGETGEEGQSHSSLDHGTRIKSSVP